MIRAAQTLLPLLLCVASPATAGPLSESACGVIAPDESGSLNVSVLPSLHVLSLTEASSRFSLPGDTPAHVQGVMCGRSSLVPSPNDYKVLAAGFPFTIATNSETPQRLAVLELVKGQVRYRALVGKFTLSEEQAFQPVLNSMQTALDDLAAGI